MVAFRYIYGGDDVFSGYPQSSHGYCTEEWSLRKLGMVGFFAYRYVDRISIR